MPRPSRPSLTAARKAQAPSRALVAKNAHSKRKFGDIYKQDGKLWLKLSSGFSVIIQSSDEASEIIAQWERAEKRTNTVNIYANIRKDNIEGSLKDKAARAFEILKGVKSQEEVNDAIKRVAFVYGASVDGATEEAPYSRFAHVEKYENRRPNEDAIEFYRRAWKDVAAPLFREDVAAHDPELLQAISQRCTNLNRGRAASEKIYSGDVLPPPRPLPPKEERRRGKNRVKQANYISRTRKLPTPP